MVAELRVSKLPPDELALLFTGIRRAVAASHGVQVVKIALVKQRTIPKTVRIGDTASCLQNLVGPA